MSQFDTSLLPKLLKAMKVRDVLMRANETIAEQHLTPLTPLPSLRMWAPGDTPIWKRCYPRPARANLRRRDIWGCKDTRQVHGICCFHFPVADYNMREAQEEYCRMVAMALRKPRRDMDQEYIEWDATRICMYPSGIFRVCFDNVTPYTKTWNELMAYGMTPTKLARFLRDYKAGAL